MSNLSHIVSASDLGGVDCDHASTGNFGENSTEIVKQAKKVIEGGDRAMLFVYFDGLKAKMMIGLEETRVKALQITGDGSRCHSKDIRRML
jgi:hypothetical protein